MNFRIHLFVVELISSNVKALMTTLVGVIAISIVKYYRSPWRRLPPGPPGLPLLGNLLALKERRLWLNFTKWSNTYGPVVHVNVVGQPLIILNTQKAAADLLEHRAAIYSDRPPNIVISEMTGGHLFVTAGCTEVWRRMRKAARKALNKGVAENQHHHVLLREAVILATGLIANSSAWNNHICRASASALVAIIYDKEPLESTKDPAIEWLRDLISRLTRAAMPGAYLVEFFTWMRHIPPRFAAWKRMALEYYRSDEEILRGLFDGVRHQIAEGSERPSLTATLIRDIECELSDVEKMWVAGTVYFAGDATTEFFQWWLAAMLAYPETQKKAQQELDEVVGRDRLPSFDDYEKLPYIRAMVKEILRWGPVAPIGLPHRSIQDDWYNGYFIPKHSVIIPNVWCMNRNPDIYGADAHHFNPARYLDKNDQMVPAPPDTKEEGHVTFGFGQRTCIGRQVANDFLFINVAVALWAMNLEYAIDNDGNPVPLNVVDCVEHGLAVRPIPFQCKISGRFPDAMSMLESSTDNLL